MFLLFGARVGSKFLFEKVQRFFMLPCPAELDSCALLQSGGWLCVKWWDRTLQTKWRGTFKALTAPTQARAAGREPWIHCSKDKGPLS